MTIHFVRCESDDDFAKASSFMLQHRFDLDPAMTTLDAVALMYTYITEGHLIQVLDGEGRVIAIGAYYYGSRGQAAQDEETALIDMALVDWNHRGTRLFLKGLTFMIGQIIEHHPKVQEVRVVAQAKNAYTCRLYGKFLEQAGTREGSSGQEMLFCGKVNNLTSILKKWNKV
ncbi:hypothetical protein WMW72_06775 [Paenibacillus filicis]|uniref:N-acetyltransferase domain-containing protein n=1 Tax=Paenibacillus filicis TaxID=669464 RepID=A0ABU9DIN5_9BACL